MIKKELFSLVLGRKVSEISKDIDNGADFEINFKSIRYVCLPDEILYSLNLDTLGRLCKEWMLSDKLGLDTGVGIVCGKIEWSCSLYRDTTGSSTEFFTGDTELAAVIKATEYIAKEQGLI